jgi:hypothetical protein
VIDLEMAKEAIKGVIENTEIEHIITVVNAEELIKELQDALERIDS